ncbi:MAG: (Fe-S)-binding protein [Pseudomonadota bacterium]
MTAATSAPNASSLKSPNRHVGLFVTCLVDLMRPSVAFAAVSLLERAGCHVVVPAAQTCCGQPAYNSGDNANARDIARTVIEAFAEFAYVVAPSGSCAAMLKVHYPELFADDAEMRAKAEHLAGRVHELTSFLVDVCDLKTLDARFDGRATYHDSCSGLRELGVKTQPRALLEMVDGLTLEEMRDCETCCGFGGTFAVKYSDVSNAIVEKKSAAIGESDADLLVAGDLGCLLNMAGKLSREGRKTEVRHVAEVLAGDVTSAAIGAPSGSSTPST